MKPDPESVQKALKDAMLAMQRGDHQAARGFAEQAAALAPDSEEPWLFLAALASPRASVDYLERALKINPHSQRARKGMHWAVERMRHEHVAPSLKRQAPSQREQAPTPEVAKTSSPVPTIRRPSAPGTQPRVQKAPVRTISRSAPHADRISPRSLARYRWSFLTLLLAAICITVVWVFWPGNISPVLAFLHVPRSTQAFPGFMAEIAKPTYTPSPTATFTPTATNTLTPTFTSTPTSTPTPTFTFTPTFTLTPTPTDTPSPTETLPPTDTPWPTDTEIPWPTNTPEPVFNPGGGEGIHWIDVNLSQQRLYAYAGDTVVASFLVSTGVSQFPTVTGQYNIYIKLLSTVMAGDGYYLPNVPYTMYFYKGYGIHGTYWHNNFGHPMSHGCVNMYTPDAEWVFNWASVGTLVNVHY
jgi:lipoprotein-anchoring transpeptidase ErfK/SrfK